MSALQIREMEPGDVEEVVRLWRRAREDAQPWLEERMGHTSDDDLRHFRDVIVPAHAIHVALRDGVPVGFLAQDGDLLGYLYVDPPVQGTGVGSALLDLAKRASPDGLRLFTHQRNEGARAFYERRAFRAVRFGVSPPPENEPDVRYVWRRTS